MGQGKRYSLKQVFWVVLAVNIFFMVLGAIVISVTPATSDTPTWDKIFSWKNLISTIISLAFSTFFYFFAVNTFHRLLNERKKSFEFVKPLVLAVLAVSGYFAISHYLFVTGKINLELDGEGMEKKLTVGLMIFSYIFSSLFYIGTSLLVAYFTFLRDEKKSRKILEEQKMQLEVEKSQANFNFLKAQINPHFLHNTLNFLYAKSLPYSAELSEGILTLSDIMRYALSEGNAKNGMAPLKDEIEHVRNVIKINQLRFSNNLKVNFDVEGVVNGHTIIPFVLITLVENAFKHGDVKSNEYPIDISLKLKTGSIYFYCRNKKKTGPKELSTGIGLDNITKRLDLAYGNNYLFNVKDEAEIYTTELTINQP